MKRIKVAAVIGLLACAACASAPVSNTEQLTSDPAYTDAISNLSRIEITERFNIASYKSELDGTAIKIGWTPSAHESQFEQSAVPEKRTGKQIDNNNDQSIGEVFEIQNSMSPPGWRVEPNAMLHLESGLRCPNDINIVSQDLKYDLSKIFHFDDTKRNVACLYTANVTGTSFSIYASHWPDITQEEHAYGAVSAIFEAYEVIEEMTVQVATVKREDDATGSNEILDDLEIPHAIGFKINNQNAEQVKTALWVVKIFDWHVKVRATYELEDQVSELIAALYFATSHLDVRAKNLKYPTVPGVDV
ncbi:hypothetical protein [Hyphococcus lacteus]|uniref:Uncharacterized protein n=1 Tax=Hyphococcus lacteus TaxID=3143536 RepID=A0ABV3Z5P0_9PROT